MQPGLPSRTAERVALSRAMHQLLDEPVVFEDPLAIPLVGRAAVAAAMERRTGAIGRTMQRFLRAFLAARSRVAEETLADAHAHGVRQYLVLGAGLDTFGYRNPWPDLRVFEVDHPATQAWKRDRLAAAGIAVPASLTHVPVDFERTTLATALPAAGWRMDQPGAIAWLGVTYYLTTAAIDATLGFIASLPRGSVVVFDYSLPASSLSLVGRAARALVTQRVRAAGEPWLSTFTPDDLATRLTALGFSDLEDLGAAELNARYFDRRGDQLRVGAGSRVMIARV